MFFNTRELGSLSRGKLQLMHAALYQRINNVNNYGVRSSWNPTERDGIFYQKNPLLYTLLEYQE